MRRVVERCARSRWTDDRYLMRMMVYLGRCTDRIVLLIADCRTSVRELLFFGRRAPLCKTLETLERVIYEYPVLVYNFAVLWQRCWSWNNKKVKTTMKHARHFYRSTYHRRKAKEKYNGMFFKEVGAFHTTLNKSFVKINLLLLKPFMYKLIFKHLIYHLWKVNIHYSCTLYLVHQFLHKNVQSK